MSNPGTVATPFAWEILEAIDGEHAETERAPVPGGWLYRTTSWCRIVDDVSEDPNPPLFVPLAQQVTFVPDLRYRRSP